ncbi:transcriptional regulator%2C Acidobacterial%2C PadR-family [uncultured Eubacterium sp.]|nr:transcriptional regulator%2C Acidobacterial%2C PadR-family [uncultured Eubacterium sp.]
MARGRSNFKMGTVEMIVLFLLQKQDLYGYQLTTLIKKQSDGNVIVTESTLYPTLYKLLKNGYISDREMPIGKRRVRVYYHLEDAGRERLADLLEDYNEITVGIERILTSDLDFTEEEDEPRD